MQNKRDFYDKRCRSSFEHDYDPLSISQLQSIREPTDFAKRLVRVICKYLPDFRLQYKVLTLDNILDSLDPALQLFTETISNQYQEKYKETTGFIQTTTSNLSKYEQLIEEKEKDLENQLFLWQESKRQEEEELERKKIKIIRMKVKLDNSIEAFKEKEQEHIEKNTKFLDGLKALQGQVTKEKLENESIKWGIEQKLSEITDKEAMIELKFKMIEDEKKQIRDQKAELENERITNRLMSEEYIKCKSHYSPNKQFLNSASVNSKFEPFSRFGSRAEDYDSPVEKSPDLKELKSIQKCLEDSKNELEVLSTAILPELHQNYEVLSSLIDEATSLKITAEEIVKSFTEKFEYYAEQSAEVQKLSEELGKGLEELAKKEAEISIAKEGLEVEKAEIAVKQAGLGRELEEFNQEKIEYFDEVAVERKRIQEYYQQIEEKMAKLHESHMGLMQMKKALEDREKFLKHLET